MTAPECRNIEGYLTLRWRRQRRSHRDRRAGFAKVCQRVAARAIWRGV